jgi:TolB-like protein
MSFFAELKRRNVVRVGIAYVVIGWLLAQIAELAFDAFGAPDWVLKSVLVMLLLGLPLVLFIAWAFEITPEGVKLEKHVDRSKSITARTGRKIDRIIIGVLVAAVGFLLLDKFYFEESPATVDEIIATESQSIAVLPFVNMSDDNDHFADGLSEELLNLLAKIPDLKVAGRTSSFAFKGINRDLREVGNALDVTKVLEGSVRRSGERLRITAQLINVADGYHIWSETYNREMADIFDIQDDVAASITDALQLHLTPGSDRPTQNAEAYAIYLEALALQTYTSGDDVFLAQELLDKAIALDPAFALAYELKSIFYWLQAGWLVDAPTSQKLAYEAAMRALELDPTLADARSYAGTAHPDWNWIMEFDALEELVRIEPNNIGALEALTYDMIIGGYFYESVRLTERIIELEPIAALGYWRNGEALSAAGRRSEAHASFERAAELSDARSMWMLGGDFLTRGDDENAIIWFEKSFSALGYDPAEVRPFIEKVRDPDSGKSFLDQWIAAEVAKASNIDERRQPYYWYLFFGYLDDYWAGIEVLAGDISAGWTNADTLEQGGMVFRHTGFAKHPKYLPWSESSSLTDLWDKRGPPDHCSKESGEWVCE